MNFREISEIKLEGLELIDELRPENVREHMSQFIERSIEIITEYLDRGEKIDLIFPMNGAAMFMYLLKQRMPQQYIDQINWVSVYRPDSSDKTKYQFVHSKGNFIGTQIVIDDIWDSGDSTEYISDAIAREIGEDRVKSLRESYVQDNRYVKSRGEIPLAVLAATSKVGKDADSAQYIFNKRNGKDNWIASAFGLNCGYGQPSTSRFERLAGVSFGVTNLDDYIRTVNDVDGKKIYEEILKQSGLECYGEDYYPMMNILESLDNEDVPIDLRNLQVLIDLGLIVEA